MDEGGSCLRQRHPMRRDDRVTLADESGIQGVLLERCERFCQFYEPHAAVPASGHFNNASAIACHGGLRCKK
jgi:hypothetical protein